MSELIEPIVILDTFVQGVGRVEEISANLFRVSYYAHQRGYDGSQERVCVAKFIVTADTMVAMANATGFQEMARRLMGQTHSALS
ncbi:MULTISPECIES: hypothetical protein [unclassified Mesorhizobium]|uniref:hypothetical protein n=1 Tax=unclassified Mesorhizobium TaxID=325217 RepID=UPI002417B349|nr:MULTISPECIES: hypothetical protein [unclassified Mesorhizobium]MDG4902800.1 hypothetical protein [Mesorhizobium sp. WSM4962]MDG4920809.1 hypothetical protein [Mesorhizobium sp. WSM4989]